MENGDIIIEDNNSQNGTFVNNYKIKRKLLKEGDNIKVGSHSFRLFHYFILKAGRIHRLRKAQDYTEEFMSLKKSWNKYQKHKGNQKSSYLSRLLVAAVPLVLLIFARTLMDEIEVSIVIVLIFVLGLTLFKLAKADKTQRRQANLQKAKKGFFSIYKCPKCQQSLKDKSWIEWKQIGKHFCGAKWR